MTSGFKYYNTHQKQGLIRGVNNNNNKFFIVATEKLI